MLNKCLITGLLLRFGPTFTRSTTMSTDVYRLVFRCIHVSVVHIILPWLKCLPTYFYPIYSQSSPIQIFRHALMPSFSASHVLLFLASSVFVFYFSCHFCLPTFRLSRLTFQFSCLVTYPKFLLMRVTSS